MPDKIARLRALLAKMPKGTWSREGAMAIVKVSSQEYGWSSMTAVLSEGAGLPEDSRSIHYAEALAAICNEFPRALDVIEAAQKVDANRDAFGTVRYSALLDALCDALAEFNREVPQ